tara:strand:- start:123 stop:461 length:339 start_codon:yes stop_codon:yes gene_type:complete
MTAPEYHALNLADCSWRHYLLSMAEIKTKKAPLLSMAEIKAKKAPAKKKAAAKKAQVKAPSNPDPQPPAVDAVEAARAGLEAAIIANTSDGKQVAQISLQALSRAKDLLNTL